MTEGPISISDFKNKKNDKKPDDKQEDFSFEDIIRRNQENEERLKKEREKANKKVKRDYRLT